MARGRTKGHLTVARSDYISSLAAFSAGAYFLSHAYSVQLFTLIGLIAVAEVIRRQGERGPPRGAPVAPVAGHVPQGRGWRSMRTAAYGAQAMVGPGSGARSMERPA
jgi:hypothetical protein